MPWQSLSTGLDSNRTKMYLIKPIPSPVQLEKWKSTKCKTWVRFEERQQVSTHIQGGFLDVDEWLGACHLLSLNYFLLMCSKYWGGVLFVCLRFADAVLLLAVSLMV